MRRWRVENGLPHNSANAVLQTQDGFVWIASYAGLARFDGHRFRVFGRESNPPLPHDRITALYEDSRSALWVGSETGDLFRFSENKFQSQSMPAAWVPTKISWIASDEAGDIWVMDRTGVLLRLSDGRLLAPLVKGDPDRIANGLVKDAAAGRLWALRTGVVGFLKEGEWTPKPLPDAHASLPIQAIGAARGGGIWATLGNGLWRWRNDEWRQVAGPETWAGSGINAVCEWTNGIVAIGTTDNGLFLLTPGRPSRHFGRGDRVGDSRIQSLAVDQEGSLWVGTTIAGVSVLQQANFDQQTPPDPLDAFPLKSVAPRRAGGVWVGSEGGGVYLYADGRWRVFGNQAGLSNSYVWSVLEDRRGDVWAGTWGGGVFRMKAGAERFSRIEGLEDPREQVAALFEARDGAIWIGTLHGLICHQGGKVTRYAVQEGLTTLEVRAIAEDRAGAIWVGLAGGGLAVLRGNRFQSLGRAEGFSADYIISLHFDDAGALWFGSTAAGVTRFKDGKFAHLGRDCGFPGVAVGNIAEDGRGNFWLSSDRGVFRIASKALNACAETPGLRLTYERFGSGEGLEQMELASGSQPAGGAGADGLLWYPARQHLLRVDPALPVPRFAAPATVIDDFVVDGAVLANGVGAGGLGRALGIRPGATRYEFRFTAATFMGGERLRFRYRMEGIDANWIDAGEDRSVVYHYLPPGDYLFEVKVVDSSASLSSPAASLALIVEPQWWETWWGRVLGYLGAAGLLAGSVAWQLRRSHRRKTEELERRQVLERERTRISRDIHDDLGASLTRISLLSQTARNELGDPEKSARRIDGIFATARELTRKMDEIVWAVNPQHDSLESVVHYLSSYAQDFLSSAGVACRLDVPGQILAWPLFAEARHHLFLVFKEALNNIVKHAGASCVTISLTASGTELVLSVQDDGKGISPLGGAGAPHRLGGNGLINMRQRMADIGGSCEIGPGPSGGTKVILKLPLRETRLPRQN